LSQDDVNRLITKLYDYYGLASINLIISVVNQYFFEYFDNCQYIAPIRATAQRNYRSQGLSIENITPQGENVPMLLDSMSKDEKQDWNNWTEKRFGIKFIVTKSDTNISLKLEKNGEEINLADTGFGYSQLLPILLYAWKSTKKNSRNFYWTSDKRKKINTLVIEQPELHLHPALQANVLDVFIELVNYMNETLEFNIVMETHSEAIINRLGQHVAFSKQKKLSEKINIIIFDEFDGELRINQSCFEKEGYLKNWPIDFFLPDMGDIV
jgi:predicted ATPase